MERSVSTLQPAFFFVPCSVGAIGPWVGAGTREEFTIVQTEAIMYAAGSAAGLHGSLHGAKLPVEHSTNRRSFTWKIQFIPQT